MLNTLMKGDFKNGLPWKTAFTVGLITLPILFHVGKGNSITLAGGEEYYIFDDDSYHMQNLDALGNILGGLLVGVGTRLGNGCTSGHSICGIPRLSLRSIVATCTFISFGMLIASVRYHYPFLNSMGMHYHSDPYAEGW